MFTQHDRERQERILWLLRHLVHEDEEIEEGVKQLLIGDEEIEKLLKEKNRPIFALTTFINHQKYIIMSDVSLVIGSPKDGLFTLIDNKTLLPISPVTYSNQALGENSNPDAMTATLDQTNNKVTFTGLAAGSGTQVITTHADYTDPGDNSAQSGDFSVTKNYTVVPSADGATFDVVFP